MNKIKRYIFIYLTFLIFVNFNLHASKDDPKREKQIIGLISILKPKSCFIRCCDWRAHIYANTLNPCCYASSAVNGNGIIEHFGLALKPWEIVSKKAFNEFMVKLNKAMKNAFVQYKEFENIPIKYNTHIIWNLYSDDSIKLDESSIQIYEKPQIAKKSLLQKFLSIKPNNTIKSKL